MVGTSPANRDNIERWYHAIPFKEIGLVLALFLTFFLMRQGVRLLYETVLAFPE